MAYLVGVAGLAGAGKTTAVDYLSQSTRGRAIYLGQVVLDEVRKRGLPETRENERLVRLELRQQHGPSCLIKSFAATIDDCLKKDVPAFVDAVFLQAEFDALKSCALEAPMYLLALEASFEVRLARLTVRSERAFSRTDLLFRDRTELETLGTGQVISTASHTIRNESSLEDYYDCLASFVRSCARAGAETP